MLNYIDFSFLVRASLASLVLFIFLYLGLLVYNAYFHPLSKFPGPELAGASRWYQGYFDVCVGYGGQFMYEIGRLHDKYGPIVRIAPNELHVQDVDFYDVLYAHGAKRDKVPYMADIFGTPLSLFGTVKHDIHKPRRAALNPFFSKRSVSSLEKVIQEKVKKMGDNMHALSQKGGRVHLRHALGCTIGDIMTEYSFGNCANMLDQVEFDPPWDEMMRGVSEIVPLARQFPRIVHLAQILPSSAIQKLNPVVASFLSYKELIHGHVEQIFKRYTKSQSDFVASASKGKRSIFEEILTSNLPENEKAVERMTQEAQNIISAACETTSSVLSTIIFYVLSTPQIRTKLQKELRGAIDDPRAQIEWRLLEQLPYLTCIVKEGLRVTATVRSRLPLIAHEPLQYKHWTIPAGTYIGMSAGDSLLDPSIYPCPKSFIPERWETTDITQLKRMETAFVPFGRGPRMCIGINLAYANLYHTLAHVFRRFDLELVDTIKERDVDTVREHFIGKPRPESRGVKVDVLKELKV